MLLVSPGERHDAPFLPAHASSWADTLIIFLLFLRYASTIILLGAEFNAEAAKRYDPATIRDKITDPRKMTSARTAHVV